MNLKYFKKILSNFLNRSEQFENERIQHERENQKRIDESLLNAALAEKCIILDEEEDVVDEFPPLKDEQLRVINFALHGPRHEVIKELLIKIIEKLINFIADYCQQI